MAEVVYFCGAVISSACAFLLARNYFKSRARILLWIAVSFGFLALNHTFVFIDLVLFPDVDLWGSFLRNLLFACAGVSLAAGLVWEMS